MQETLPRSVRRILIFKNYPFKFMLTVYFVIIFLIV